MMKRRVFVSLLLAGLGIVMFSLGAVAQKKVVVWEFGGLPAEHKWLEECVTTFNAAHPGIKVVRIEKSWMTKSEELISAWQMRTMPDVIARDSVSIPDMVEMGMLAPLSDLFPKDIARMKDRWIPECWNLGTYKGKVYGILTYVDIAPMVAYNRGMFAKAGVLFPSTWEELIKAAKKLTTKDHYGVIIPGTLGLNDLEIFIGIAYVNGGRFLTPEGDRVVFNGKGTVDALKLYVDLLRKYKVAPPGTVEIDYMKAIELFLRNRGAMTFCMSWVPVIAQNLGVPKGFLYKLAPFPMNSTPSGQFPPASAIMDGTHTFALVSTSEVKEEAWEFIKYATRPESMRMWAGVRIQGRVPATHEGFKTPEIAEIYPDLVQAYKKGIVYKGALSMPSFPGFTEMVKIFGQAFQSALLGEGTPQDLLNEAQEECQDILEEM